MSQFQLLLNDYKLLFCGNEHEYGQHIYGDIVKGKKETNGKSWTEKEKLLVESHYKDHLQGKRGLGIVPINKNNQSII